MSTTRERRWWTSEEDEILKNGVKNQYESAQNWNNIAALLPGRTNKDCRKRWSKIQLDIRKGPWAQAEDDSLRQAVQRFGLKWSQVAIKVRSRNADQCAKRWQHVLGPDFKHCPWSPEEDRKLLDAMKRHANNWKQIGLTDLPDRSPHDIRNRSLLLGRRQRSHNMLDQEQSPSTAERDTVGASLRRNDQEDTDMDVYDGSSESDETGLVSILHSQTPSRNFISQPQISASSAPCLALPDFQSPLTPLTMIDASNPCPDLDWTGSAGHLQPPSEFSTPSSDSLPPLDSLQVKPSSMLPTACIDETVFDKEEVLDFDIFDMPGVLGDKRDTALCESGQSGVQNKSQGNITVTLTQVDPEIALEITRSLLKHKKSINIQCIFNDA